MITGSHVIVSSRDAEADRAFFADVLGHPNVDAGGGWLIFKMADLRTNGVEFTEDVSEQRWGRLSRFRLPGGGQIGIYEPRHPLAIDR